MKAGKYDGTVDLDAEAIIEVWNNCINIEKQHTREKLSFPPHY